MLALSSTEPSCGPAIRGCIPRWIGRYGSADALKLALLRSTRNGFHCRWHSPSSMPSSPTCEERCYSSVVLRCVRSLCGRLTMSVSTWLVLGRWTYSTYLHRQRGLVAWHVGTSPGHISGEVQSTCCQCSGSHTLIAYISYLVRSSPFMPYPGVSGIDKDAFMLFICRGVVNPLIGGLHRWHLARHGSVGGLQPWSLTATSAGYRLECCLHTTG